MNYHKSLKKIKIIGIIMIALGVLMVLSNGLSYLVLKLTDYPYEIEPFGKFYLSPIYLVLNGILLIISGLLIKSYKKIGLSFTVLTTILTLIIITLHSTVNFKDFQGDLKLIGTISSIGFILIFLIPSIIMIRFLLKKENVKTFFK